MTPGRSSDESFGGGTSAPGNPETNRGASDRRIRCGKFGQSCDARSRRKHEERIAR